MIRLFKHYLSYNVVLLSILDLLILLASGEAAWRLRLGQIGTSIGPLGERTVELGGFALVIWLTMIGVGAYSPEALRSMRVSLARILVAMGLGLAAIALANYILPGTAFWRSILFYATLIAICALALNRWISGRLLGVETFRRRILVLGAGNRAARLKRMSARR